MFRENLGIKLFSLFLAAMIWVQIQFTSEHRSVVNIPVSLKNVPENLTLDKLPQSIPFYVKGKGLDIMKLELSKAHIIIDASNVQPGEGLISMADYRIDMPSSINLNFIGPVEKQDLAINAEEYHQKRVPVRLTFSDKSIQQKVDNYSYELIPDKVTVFGPKSKLRKIGSIYSEPISEDLAAQKEFVVKLIPGSEDVSVSESQVRVKIISNETTQRVLDGIPLKISPGSDYFPREVAIKIAGSSEQVSRLNMTAITASPAQEADSDGMCLVNVTVPPGIKVLGVTPSRVRKKN